MPSPDLIAKLTALANSCNDADVAAWMHKHVAFEIREDRPRRKRGVEVTLGRINRKVQLDAARCRSA